MLLVVYRHILKLTFQAVLGMVKKQRMKLKFTV